MISILGVGSSSSPNLKIPPMHLAMVVPMDVRIDFSWGRYSYGEVNIFLAIGVALLTTVYFYSLWMLNLDSNILLLSLENISSSSVMSYPLVSSMRSNS